MEGARFVTDGHAVIAEHRVFLRIEPDRQSPENKNCANRQEQ